MVIQLGKEIQIHSWLELQTKTSLIHLSYCTNSPPVAVRLMFS